MAKPFDCSYSTAPSFTWRSHLTASNGQVFEQNAVEALNYPTKKMIQVVKERILATTLPLNSIISQDPKEVYSHIHSSSLSLFLSASNSSAYPIAIAAPLKLVTQFPLPVDFGLLAPIQPSCKQVDIFQFPASIVCTCHTMHICKQLYIATLHLGLLFGQARPRKASVSLIFRSQT